MFVPCIARLSINNQHYVLDYITSLFNMQAPTCFGSCIPSSGSFLDPCELREKQNNYMVYRKRISVNERYRLNYQYVVIQSVLSYARYIKHCQHILSYFNSLYTLLLLCHLAHCTSLHYWSFNLYFS
jgi:hypothetical protein